jgi:hypothetical protein
MVIEFDKLSAKKKRLSFIMNLIRPSNNHNNYFINCTVCSKQQKNYFIQMDYIFVQALYRHNTYIA